MCGSVWVVRVATAAAQPDAPLDEASHAARTHKRFPTRARTTPCTRTAPSTGACAWQELVCTNRRLLHLLWSPSGEVVVRSWNVVWGRVKGRACTSPASRHSATSGREALLRAALKGVRATPDPPTRRHTARVYPLYARTAQTRPHGRAPQAWSWSAGGTASRCCSSRRAKCRWHREKRRLFAFRATSTAATPPPHGSSGRPFRPAARCTASGARCCNWRRRAACEPAPRMSQFEPRGLTVYGKMANDSMRGARRPGCGCGMNGPLRRSRARNLRFTARACVVSVQCQCGVAQASAHQTSKRAKVRRLKGKARRRQMYIYMYIYIYAAPTYIMQLMRCLESGMRYGYGYND